METELNHFTVADYDTDGAVIEVTEVAIEQLDEMQVEWFEKKLAKELGRTKARAIANAIRRTSRRGGR